MLKDKVGKIELVEIRTVFKKEDQNFTPWLNENLLILGEVLNLDLIDNSIEENVGSFSCDIIARDSDSNKTVIIENQYGATDHDHLGKIFTYASGKDASIVIWIAERIREEHKKALEWLNENVAPDSGLSFFGIEIRIIMIENSPPAPDFRVIVKPNDWERSIKLSSQTISETFKKYLAFYRMLADEYATKNPKWRKVKAQPQNWLSFGAGKGGLGFGWVFKGGNRFAVELYIDTGDKNENDRIFEELEKHKAKIDENLKGLSWERLDERRACRISKYRSVKGSIKSIPESDYPEIINWATESMNEFSRLFEKYIRRL